MAAVVTVNRNGDHRRACSIHEYSEQSYPVVSDVIIRRELIDFIDRSID